MLWTDDKNEQISVFPKLRAVVDMVPTENVYIAEAIIARLILHTLVVTSYDKLVPWRSNLW